MYSKCSVEITADNLLAAKTNNYIAFNDCAFRIGAETIATKLTGSNADGLRQNFVDRCTTQGLTVPSYTEFGGTTKVGRWVFSNTSISGDYNVIEGSEINRFAKQRGFYFGHNEIAYKVLPIVTAENVPNSFTPFNPASQMKVAADSITLDVASLSKERVSGYVDSKIVWLGGKSRLSDLSVSHSFPAKFGMTVGSEYAYSPEIESGSIEEGLFYIIRSKTDNAAIVKYNNVDYTSSLVARNHIFRGVKGVNSFTTVSGEPQVLQVLDFVNLSNIRLRIVDEIPAQKITTGNIQKDYWYIVIPNDLSDQNGSVTYNGVQRPCFDSFVAGNTLTFTVNGNCHLRRCWHKDFNFDTETTDKAFWAGKQKPKYLAVCSDDLRCFRENHSPAAVEMQSDEKGDYIGSAHVEFYNGINGVTGSKFPAFDIAGTFMQVQIPVSTLNPM